MPTKANTLLLVVLDRQPYYKKEKQKPVALFIDEAHDIHGNTLVGLKRLLEMIHDCAARFP